MFTATKNIIQEGDKVQTVSIDGEVLDEQSFASEEEANEAFWVEFHAINENPDMRIEVYGDAAAQISERV